MTGSHEELTEDAGEKVSCAWCGKPLDPADFPDGVHILGAVCSRECDWELEAHYDRYETGEEE